MTENKQFENKKANRDDSALLEIYRQCYESYRQHDRFIWQIPSVIGIITSVIAIVFKFVGESSTSEVREVEIIKMALLWFGFVISLALSIALVKHRYFSEIEQGTLCILENKLAGKVIQRLTDPKKILEDKNLQNEFKCKNVQDIYFYLRDPISWFERRQAAKWLTRVSFLMTLVLFLFAVYYFLKLVYLVILSKYI